MPPATSSKKKFSIGSFASPKTRNTPDPEALQRLMKKTEVEGGGGLDAKSDSEVVAKPPTAIHSVAREAEPELEAAPSTPVQKSQARTINAAGPGTKASTVE